MITPKKLGNLVCFGVYLDSGVSRISFRGGGFKIFLEKWGNLQGGSGACSPEKILKNGAIWCVLESILLKFCQKNIFKNSHFLYKNNR